MKTHAPTLIVVKPGRMRDSLRALLRAIPRIRIIGQADDCPAAVQIIEAHRPVLVLFDFDLFDHPTQAAFNRLKAAQPDTRGIILVDNAEQQRLARAGGADEVLMAGFPAARLFEAVERLLSSPRRTGVGPPETTYFETVQHLTLRNSFDAATARTTVRELAAARGYGLTDQTRLANTVAEVARNIVTYAGQGEIVVSWHDDRLQRKGLVFLCHDQGLNAPALASVLQAGGNGSPDNLSTLRLGRLVDEFSVSQDPEHGNCVKIAHWME